MNREEYLRTITEQIRCKMVRETIEKEITCHIEDQKAAFLNEGMNETDAEDAAIREMGDPVTVGLEMDKIHRPTMAWGVVTLIVGLTIIGYVLRKIMFQTVDGMGQNPLAETGSSWHFSMELPTILLGLTLMIIVCYVDYTRIAGHAKQLLIAYEVLILCGQYFFGGMIYGSTRYICFGGLFSLNIIDLLWLTIPLFAAVLYQYRGQGYRVLIKTLLWMIFPACFLITGGQSLVAATILCFVYCAILALAVYKGWFIVKKKSVLSAIAAFLFAQPLLLAGGFWLFGKAYQKERIINIFSLRNYSVGYQQKDIVRNMLIGSSAFSGNPNFKEFLPVVNGSTHLLASVSAAYGIMVGILLVVIFLFILLKFAKISIQQRNQLGMMMGTGCTILFLIQMIICLSENLGILGNMGIYCPFFGISRSGMIVSYILFGLMLSICRYQNTAPEPILHNGKERKRKKLFA